MSRPLVSVVVVNYNGWPDVEALVAALAASDEIARGVCEILVVDNASADPPPESFLRPVEGVRLNVRPDNGGFAVGVNAGWRASNAPWVLLLNPDVSVEPGLLKRVVERVRHYEEGEPPGIVGFALRNPDGSPQHSVGRFPTLGRAFREQLIPRSRRKYQPVWSTRPGPVDWVTGACLLANARLLETLGGLDEDFFLYYEEVALCRSARRLGWRVEFDPSVEVVHLRPLQNRGVSPKLRVITRHSKLLYFRKHLPRWQFLALCAVVAAESRVKGAWARLRGRPEEAGAWRVIAQVERELRSGIDLSGQTVLSLAESATTRETAGIARPTGRSRPETKRAPSRRT
ncbi:MAG: glycosyltransferase family 2 protein [Isosphaeraceae bacterium]